MQTAVSPSLASDLATASDIAAQCFAVGAQLIHALAMPRAVARGADAEQSSLDACKEAEGSPAVAKDDHEAAVGKENVV
jgi:hypothetical protein